MKQHGSPAQLPRGGHPHGSPAQLPRGVMHGSPQYLRGPASPAQLSSSRGGGSHYGHSGGTGSPSTQYLRSGRHPASPAQLSRSGLVISPAASQLSRHSGGGQASPAISQLSSTGSAAISPAASYQSSAASSSAAAAERELERERQKLEGQDLMSD